MLDESMSSDAEGALFLSISSAGSSRHRSEELLDTGDPFWEFINELKYPQIEESEEDKEPVDEGVDGEINNEQEDEENEDNESAYDSDDDEN